MSHLKYWVSPGALKSDVWGHRKRDQCSFLKRSTKYGVYFPRARACWLCNEETSRNAEFCSFPQLFAKHPPPFQKLVIDAMRKVKEKWDIATHTEWSWRSSGSDTPGAPQAVWAWRGESSCYTREWSVCNAGWHWGQRRGHGVEDGTQT